MELEAFKNFFNRPGINKKGICEESKVSYSLLQQVLTDEVPLTKQAYNRFLPTMLAYGFTVKEFTNEQQQINA